MSMTTSTASYSLIRTLKNKNPSHRRRGLFVDRVTGLKIQYQIFGNGNGVCFPGNYRSLFLLNTSQGRPRDLTVYASVPPAGAPLPSGPPSNTWRNWIIGMVMTLILPFFTHKWGPLQTILKRIDNAVETAEEVTDVIEAVANKVDKVAEDISDGLAEGGKLRKAADFVEDVAERIAKDAHLVGNLIDQVEELEEKVESFIEPVADHQATKAPEIANPNAHAQQLDKN